jgi:tetratricopeptide (TPR) repeat protein
LRNRNGSKQLDTKQEQLGTTAPFMTNLLHDFARSAPAEPRAAASGSRPAARVACWALSGLLLAATAGCGGLGFVPGMGGDADRHEPIEPEEAVDQLASTRAQLALAPNEPYWSFRMGELYAAADSTTLAMQYLGKTLAVDPSYAPAATLLSKLYYRTGLYAQGVDMLDGFLARNPQAPDEIRVALALHLDAAGEAARAETVLAQCARDSQAASEARAYVTLRGQNPKSALASAKQALDADDGSAVNHNNYGIALLHAGRPVEAREHFKNALSIDDQLPGALYNMAIVEAFYFFDEAAGREWFARYKKIASDDPDDLATRFGTKVSSSGNAPKQP